MAQCAPVKAYRHFVERELPRWGADLSVIDFDSISYYLKPVEEQAVRSGGSFIYVPPGVRVELPLQASFRITRRTWASSSAP
jgi:Fe-S cluster assembly scaffold protein SufB